MKYRMKSIFEIKDRIENIIEERKNFIHNDCTIDALLGIDENNYDRCLGCSNFAQVKDKIYVCIKLDLQELR